jgi:cation diffusion facilitator CzcD-associated flavoprotein CzcO
VLTTTGAIVIGTGFSGLGLAVAMKRSGHHDFVMLERAAEVGGTWRDNTYPGAACDIQSHLYSYSFRPNPHWSRVYASQPEILAYLKQTAEDEELYPHIRFNATVTHAEWDEADRTWAVRTTSGSYRAPALVSAAGHLSDPSYPDIDGLQDFRGTIFHSARWDHQCDPAGKRIGVIGTGASAIQIVPEIQPVAGHLTVFQRTAPWVIPRPDHAYTPAERRTFERVPESAQQLRNELFWGNEARFPQRRLVPAFINEITGRALDHLNAQVADPALREKLRPDYQIGCKRILISSEYYPALTKANVTLETNGIASVDATGIITGTGDHVDLDAIIVATGFEAAELPIANIIYGRDGEALAEHWEDGGRAFACTTVSGFPNLFVMLGPNTGLGAGSMIFMVETQISYIREALRFISAEGAVIEPDQAAETAYVESIQARSQGSVWLSGGCSSWYLHPRSGRLTTLWPDFMSQFRRENGTFRLDGYHVKRAPAYGRS